MEELIIYTYTIDRFKEFQMEKKDNEYIVSPSFYIEKKESIDDTNIYYFDITHFYKTFRDNNSLMIENLLIDFKKIQNFRIIINFNLKNKFFEDFGMHIKEFRPINNIHISDDEFLGDFSTLSDIELNKISENLNLLIGHEKFKDDFIKKLKNFSILNKLGEIKVFSLLLCGSSGVGKTEFAKIIHDSLYSNSNLIKINLGNYKSHGSLNSLIGSPKGYVGSERGGELSNKIKNSNSKVILIDEFEKADVEIFNFFYELLEDGKFTDLDENEYNLNGYLIVFTTNLNKENYNKILPLPLLSRFTMKSLFENLDLDDKIKYVKYKANKLIEKYNNEKLNSIIDLDKLLSKIDNKKINMVTNLRKINSIIYDELINLIEENKIEDV